MRLISHMEPSQMRLGYLCCLSLIAGRQLDTRQGLVDRLLRFLFRPVDSTDPNWPRFLELADLEELERMRAPVDEKVAELQELFRVKKADKPSYQLQALWLAQRDLPSHLGLLTEKGVERILEMGRSFEILTTGYALSEKGVFLQHFLNATMPGAIDGSPDSNPFAIHKRGALQWLFLYTLLSADILTPFLLAEFARSPEGDPSNAPKFLPRAAEALVAKAERVTDISTVEALRACSNYSSRLKTKGVARNQAQPRYHHLFELGLLNRVEQEVRGRRVVPYVATEEGLRAAQVLTALCELPDDQQDTLDRHFFAWTSRIYGITAKTSENDLQRLYYFARGFPYLEREIGFTPGRTVALAGCLLALEEGCIIEVADMFRALQTMAAGPWRPYLEYSGGSRLDQEFLIKVKPGLLPALESKLAGHRHR